jgi:hypothetical protein
MGQIPIEVKRTEAVSVEAVSTAVCRAVEWMQENGFIISPSAATRTQLRDASDQELAEIFAKEWKESLL